MAATITVLILFAFLVLWYFLTYNSLVAARNATEQTWSNAEVELKRRFDLIGNLVEVVKGYAQHERGTFEKIVELRSKSQSFPTAGDANAREQETGQAVKQLMVLAEAYPQLKADTQFQNLQRELTETENRIAERREAYNETVNLYLNACQSFPSNVIASLHSFKEKAFFDAPDEVAAAPTVKLS